MELADERLPEHVEVALYRIAQEALQNVLKHSNASSARVIFAVHRHSARLEIRDDGVGFSPERPSPLDRGGYGLNSMAERTDLVGGRLTIRSWPGSGTSVVVTVPLASPDTV
jgi:signal transduction histidine kinase